MNKYELIYAMTTPKPSVIPMTDPVYETKSPSQMLADLNKALVDGWERVQPGPIHMTIAIPTKKNYTGGAALQRTSLRNSCVGVRHFSWAFQMKRGAPLTRKKPMNRGKPKKASHDYMVDKGFVSASTLQPLPKLPPIPNRKANRPKTTKARQAARGRECTIRVPGVCERTNETVVLCHYRLAGTSGMGEKPHDSQAAFGCHACHDAVDGRRTTSYSKTDLRLMHCEGILRTQAILRAEAER